MAVPTAIGKPGRPRGSVPRKFFVEERVPGEKDDPALSVVCPICGALRGRPCTITNGNEIERPHNARQLAAGKGRRA